ncbi:MAG: lipoprotein signal peptidase [Bacteroidales bacterium]|nr:lipoprotein signal peptidase [Bacteroidales bacterium]
MNNSKRKFYFFAFFILLLLFFDQLLKIYIKTNFLIGEERYVIGKWFRLLFIENEGMAFGISFGSVAGKYILTTIRIIAFFIFLYFLYKSIVKNAPLIQSFVFALIVSGALGNIIDSLFYGLIFEHSHFYGSGAMPARMFPPDGGYAGFMQGKVVDMFYFPIFEIQFPSWLPFLGGREWVFFEPIFNLADTYVTTSVLILLVFYKKVFPPAKR